MICIFALRTRFHNAISSRCEKIMRQKRGLWRIHAAVAERRIENPTLETV